MSDINDLVPVLTLAADPNSPPAPTPQGEPERGRGVWPAWFTLTGDHGWRCAHHHPDPRTPSAVSRMPTHRLTNSALEHLDRHHPGWKQPCAACRRPQWNHTGSPHCADCRATT